MECCEVCRRRGKPDSHLLGGCARCPLSLGRPAPRAIGDGVVNLNVWLDLGKTPMSTEIGTVNLSACNL